MKNKYHLTGGSIRTLCGIETEIVEYVFKISDVPKGELLCKRCRKYAKDFQK